MLDSLLKLGVKCEGRYSTPSFAQRLSLNHTVTVIPQSVGCWRLCVCGEAQDHWPGAGALPSTVLIQTRSQEIVLNIVVERKKMSDLIASLTEGRYQEQRQRLRKSGIARVVFLIEGQKPKHCAMPDSTIATTLATLNAVFGFSVHYTLNLADSVKFLGYLARCVSCSVGLRTADQNLAVAAAVVSCCRHVTDYYSLHGVPRPLDLHELKDHVEPHDLVTCSSAL